VVLGVRKVLQIAGEVHGYSVVIADYLVFEQLGYLPGQF